MSTLIKMISNCLSSITLGVQRLRKCTGIKKEDFNIDDELYNTDSDDELYINDSSDTDSV